MGKQSACNAEDTRDVGSIHRPGTSPGGENGNSLQYSSLKKPMDRAAWWATVHEVTELDTTEQLTLSLSRANMINKGWS